MKAFFDNKKINNLVTFTDTAVCKISYWLSVVFFTILSIASLCSTCYFDEKYREIVLYKIDNIFLNVILFVVAIFLIGLILRNNKLFLNDKLHRKYLPIFIFVYTLLMGILWMYLTRANQGPGEGNSIIQYSSQLFNGNFINLGEARYYGFFPFQLGYTLFCEIMYFFFGDMNVTIIQLSNVFFTAGTNLFLLKIAKEIFDDKRIEFVFAILLMCFLPNIFFVTFTYGIMGGFFFSSISILMAIKFTQRENIRYMIISILSIMFGVIMKSNMQIIAIAVLVMLFIYMIKNKSKLAILFIVIYMASIVVAPKAVCEIYHMRAGEEYQIKTSMPKIVWLAMGLQDSKLAPGWFNGYTYLAYRDAGNNWDMVKKNAVESIKSSVKKFYREPKYAVEFFAQKTLSQWNEPNYGAFVMSYAARTGKNPKAEQMIYQKGKVNTLLNEEQDLVHLLTYVGAVVFLITNRRDLSVKKLLPSIIILGGLIFHTFWEGKSQYILQYAMFALMCSAPGIVVIGEKMNKIADRFF